MTPDSERLERQIAGFEKAWNYDASYMRDLLRAGPEVLIKFQGLTSIVDAKAAPADVLFAAQTLGVLDGDCEPCVQVGVDIALASGVDAATVRAVLTGDEAAMSEDVTGCRVIPHQRPARDRVPDARIDLMESPHLIEFGRECHPDRLRAWGSGKRRSRTWRRRRRCRSRPSTAC